MFLGSVNAGSPADLEAEKVEFHMLKLQQLLPVAGQCGNVTHLLISMALIHPEKRVLRKENAGFYRVL